MFVLNFVFNDTATTEIYTYRHTLSPHDALPIWASKCLERSMKIKDIRASLHGFSISIPLLEGRVQGYGREEQTHFVFCEVETDEGHVGYGLTGHFLAKSVIVALQIGSAHV